MISIFFGLHEIIEPSLGERTQDAPFPKLETSGFFCYSELMTEMKIIHGAIVDANSGRHDSLFRVSLKAVILDSNGRILVVKESGRDWWDLPGGGIEHGETIKDALARELHEEVCLEGDFEYEVLLAEDPHYLEDHNLYQMRITFLVKPSSMIFKNGNDSDEVQFVNAELYEKSDLWNERQIFMFSMIAKNK